MITLYGFSPNFGLSDPSPFVLKVEAYLKMAGIPYQKKYGLHYLKKSPKGKLPYIVDQQTTVADSQFIIDYLEQKNGQSLDGHLSAAEKALSYLIKKSLDEHFYFILVYCRWLDNECWPTVKQAFFGKFPWLLRMLVPVIARRKVSKMLFMQGTGRHTESEITALYERNLQELSNFLGNKTFAFGDKPCTLDATLYGFLAQIYLSDMESRYKTIAKGYPVLAEYCQRIRAEFDS